MDQVNQLLTRRVEKILPYKEELEKILRSGKKLRLYQGFDPSSANLHIGHLVGLLQLKMFQDLGHEIIFLIGDFTAMIGDPTDKSAARPKLGREEVLKNAATYKEQASKILSFSGPNPAQMKFNSEWLDKLSLADIIELASNFTVQQMIERDMFQERIKQEKAVFLHELIYPLMVTYDAIAMDVDLEVGGNDQLFNMMVGRQLIKQINHKDKFVITTKLLTDSEGKKIGKTTGNAINLFGDPNNLFGQIMSLPDDTTIPAFKLITTLPLTAIEALRQSLNPMDLKKRLSFEIVSICHGLSTAQAAQAHFEATIQNGQAPENIPTFALSQLPQNSTIIDLLETAKLVQSRGEAKRLLQQQGVAVNQFPISNLQFTIKDLKSGDIISIGKRKWLKLV